MMMRKVEPDGAGARCSSDCLSTKTSIVTVIHPQSQLHKSDRSQIRATGSGFSKTVIIPRTEKAL